MVDGSADVPVIRDAQVVTGGGTAGGAPMADAGRRDGGVRLDAGVRIDAGVRFDGGVPRDAGVSDGGAVGRVDGGTIALDGGVNCQAFLVRGDLRGPQGASWTYTSTDDGVSYALSGRLFAPPDAGNAELPAVIISHGKGGMPAQPPQTAQTMRDWGLVVIAPRYTHALDDDGGLPLGDEGASVANIARAAKTLQLLTCLPVSVDFSRIAAHGHSKGAYLTGGLVGTYSSFFRAASHTAGGVTSQGSGTSPAQANGIETPYQMHHSTADCTVLHRYDEALRDTLTLNGTPNELHSYFYDAGVPGCPTANSGGLGTEHAAMQIDPVMYGRVRDWYLQWGVLQ
jgi:dienelactone hydrolase